MAKLFAMVAVFIISMSFGIHFVVIRQLSKLFAFNCAWPTMLGVMTGATLNFALAAIVSRAVWNTMVRIWWVGTVCYIGVLWILFAVLIGFAGVQFILQFFFPIPPEVYQLVVPVIIVVVTAYSFFSARPIEVKTVTLTSTKVQEPLTIVQLSDLHVGATHGVGFVEGIVDRTNSLKPDLVAITGDLVDMGTSEEMLRVFKTLNAPAFFVWGNHDSFIGEERVKEIFQSTPITILKNESVLFEKGLYIIGMDFFKDRSKNDEKTVLSSLAYNEDYFTLLLSHEPVEFSMINGFPIDLQLAGHTHNGQIFPFNLIVRLRYPLVHGLYRSADQTTYVSSGAGTWGPPMRLGTKNEISLIRILPAHT